MCIFENREMKQRNEHRFLSLHPQEEGGSAGSCAGGNRHPGSGRRACRKRMTAGRIAAAGLLAAALFFMLRGSTVYVQAGTGSSRTKVIYTASEDDFARETSRLAKKSRGLSIMSSGEVRPYSSGRLIVRVRDGESVDFSKYGADTVIQSTFGVSIAQFSSESAARKAAKQLTALSSVVYAEPDDCTMNTGDMEIREITSEEDPPAVQDMAEGSSFTALTAPAQMLQVSPLLTSSEGEAVSMPAASLGGAPATVQEIPSDAGTDRIGEPGDPEINGRTYDPDEDVLFETSVRPFAASSSYTGMSWGVSYIQADKYAAFVKANTSRTIVVGVVDSGVSSHTKLTGRLLKGRDFVDNDSNPTDKNGHGTHVAGTIVDCTPGLNVKILPVRTMNASGFGNPSTVGNGIRYAVNQGAKVINLSLGGYSHYKYIEECVDYAQKKNVTVVVAAGNDCDNTRFICPAHMSSPIVVGAIGKNGKRAFFSNYGTSLDIVAPGVDIKSCWLKGKYAVASGTSMAAPHISAAAAMYRLMNPSVTASKIQYFVRCYAKDLGPSGTDNYYGRGVPRMAGAITPSKVSLNKSSTSLQLKKTMTLKASITPSYAGKNKLTWSSSNSNVVAVTGGKLTAKKKGTATITVRTVNGKKATCKVTVTNPAVSASAATVRILQDNIASSFLAPSKTPKQAVKTASAAAAAPASGRAAADGTAAAAQPESPAAEAGSVPDPSDPSTDLSDPSADPSSASSQTVKLYIYPSDAAGNAPVQDGSVVAGSTLALDAEIVPAMQEKPSLVWSSSDPSVAEIDGNGVVTALAGGQTTITAVLPAGSVPDVEEGTAGAVSAGSPAGNAVSGDGARAAAAAGTGSFTISVVEPSILTRNASYDAGAETSLQIDAVLRLPGVIDPEASAAAPDPAAADRAGDEAADPSASYVLALLREGAEEEKAVLLGAVDLGGENSGRIHFHDSESGLPVNGVRTVAGAAGASETEDLTADPVLVTDRVLSDLIRGRSEDQAGILAAEKVEADGGKASLSLTADTAVLRLLSEYAGEDPAGSGDSGSGGKGSQALWNCRLAVYTVEAFEERERAWREEDQGALLKADSGALCSCPFTLAFETSGAPRGADSSAVHHEDPADSAPAADGPGAPQAPDTDAGSEDTEGSEDADGAEDGTGSDSDGREPAEAPDEAGREDEENTTDSEKSENTEKTGEAGDPANGGKDEEQEASEKTVSGRDSDAGQDPDGTAETGSEEVPGGEASVPEDDAGSRHGSEDGTGDKDSAESVTGMEIDSGNKDLAKTEKQTGSGAAGTDGRKSPAADASGSDKAIESVTTDAASSGIEEGAAAD